MRVKAAEVKSYKAAKRLCPWASKIAKTEGGYMCFESVNDYYQWRQQK